MESEQPNSMINKLLENQLYSMFQKFDTDLLDALTVEQFQKYVYSIGFDFINMIYNSGEGELFHTVDNKEKSRVTFPEFMRYLGQKSNFGYSQAEYRGAMEILDQDNLGKEASVDDAIRVLSTYSNMSKNEIDDFIRVSQEGDSLQNLFKRLSTSLDPEQF